MIRQDGEYMLSGQWWAGLFPGLALLLMVLGLNFVGDVACRISSIRDGARIVTDATVGVPARNEFHKRRRCDACRCAEGNQAR
jgi:hypothetical protein